MALYSIRLDGASEEALARVARSRNVTRAVVLREAIAEYGRANAREMSPYDGFSSLIGVIVHGPGNLSERTGERFAQLVDSARDARMAVRTKSKASAPSRRKAR